jgi:hypothetical protein
MKKVFFTIMMSAICGMATAQSVYIPNVQILQGGKAYFHIFVNVGDKTDLVGMQYESLNLPTGLSVTGEVTKWDANGQFLAAGTKLSAVSMPKGTTPTFFPTGEFEIGAVEIEASEDMVLKDYTVTIPANDCVFMSEATNYPIAEKISFKVSVVNRLILDENSAIAPSATTGKVDVHVARTINAGSWSTICLPISLNQTQAVAAFGSDALYGEFDGFSTEYTDLNDVTPDAIVLKFKKLTLSARSQLGAGKPYLIKTTKNVDGFDVDGVQIVNTVTSVDKDDENKTDGSFVGTLAKTKVPADALFISGNKFWYSTGDSETKAFRAWFALGAVLDKETTDFSSRVMIKFIDDDATGIKSVNTTSGEEIYTLSGQRVKNAGKGVYIVNGKKVIKK